jgi:hypothetical protein
MHLLYASRIDAIEGDFRFHGGMEVAISPSKAIELKTWRKKNRIDP